MVDEIRREIWLIVENERDVVCAGNVFRGDDRELVPRQIAFKRNVRDLPPCGGAAHSRAVQHLGKREIVDVKRRAGDFLSAFFSRKRFPDRMIHGVYSHLEEIRTVRGSGWVVTRADPSATADGSDLYGLRS